MSHFFFQDIEDIISNSTEGPLGNQVAGGQGGQEEAEAQWNQMGTEAQWGQAATEGSRDYIPEFDENNYFDPEEKEELTEVV